MLVHTQRNLIIPQYEHTKMVGILSQHWGNPDFALPNIPLNDFYLACYTHDLGFGGALSDSYQIGNMSKEERKEVVTKCVSRNFSSPIEAIVVKKHFQRLLQISSYDFPDLKANLDKQIEQLINTTEIPKPEFELADTIIDLLDAIAFDFSTGESTNYTVHVQKNTASDDSQQISYEINDSQVSLNK